METKIVTKQGAVQGLLCQDGRTVIFRGVPYAQPPVGELRFPRPQAPQPWEGGRAERRNTAQPSSRAAADQGVEASAGARGSAVLAKTSCAGGGKARHRRKAARAASTPCSRRNRAKRRKERRSLPRDEKI